MYEQHEDGLFPPYFSVLFAFASDFVLPPFASPDAKVLHVCQHYSQLLQDTCGIVDPAGEEYFKRRSAAMSAAMDPVELRATEYVFVMWHP